MFTLFLSLALFVSLSPTLSLFLSPFLSLFLSFSLYQPVSKLSSSLFFVVTELSNVDPMYMNSLVWFQNIFTDSILGSENSDDLVQRIHSIKEHFSENLYTR